MITIAAFLAGVVVGGVVTLMGIVLMQYWEALDSHKEL
jgi:hypothetical protein